MQALTHEFNANATRSSIKYGHGDFASKLHNLGLLYTDELRRVKFNPNSIRLRELNSSESKESIYIIKEKLLYTDELRRIKRYIVFNQEMIEFDAS